LEVSESGKHSSLLPHGIDYGHKKPPFFSKRN
jgi:hypothetical protein